MWFKVKSFISFLFKSTNQHGVHSPFVYDLVTKCFYKKTNSTKISKVNNAKQWLHSNKQLIQVTDFGSGSKIFKNNNRKISDIAKVAGITHKKASLLLRLLAYFEPSTILEIGTSLGLGTTTLSIGSPNSKIDTLEGCHNTGAIAQELFDRFECKNVQLIMGTFHETLKTVIRNKSFDLIYFDGNHKKDATLNYFNECLQTAHNNSVFIFDDIHWSIEMQEAWSAIKEHPKVTVTIDTYFWGLVFFREEQAKQHFTIRC